MAPKITFMKIQQPGRTKSLSNKHCFTKIRVDARTKTTKNTHYIC